LQNTVILKANEREKDGRKRSLSGSSAGTPDVGESDAREKERDKKGRKNSVFGNLFKKKSKKPSKDEEVNNAHEITSISHGRGSSDASTNRSGSDDLTHIDRTDISPVARANPMFVESHPYDKDDTTFSDRKVSSTESNAARRLAQSPDEAEFPLSQSNLESREHVSEAQISPVTASESSGLPTPSLPWSDSSLSTFLDNDTTIRDALVLIREGGRLVKHSRATINPQIADLYSVCTIHIEEMATVRLPTR
jgi:hypothetical protein